VHDRPPGGPPENSEQEHLAALSAAACNVLHAKLLGLKIVRFQKTSDDVNCERREESATLNYLADL
jgi:hypothetical protein